MALSDLITSLRVLAQDGPADHTVFGENLGSITGMPIDGANQNFRLGGQDGHSLPVVAGSVYITNVGTTFRTQSGFTLTDAVNGVVNFTSAPAVNSVLQADYNYYWFTDAKYTEFLNQAAQTTLAGATGPAAVPDGLREAMMQYALSLFFTSRASQYAERYSSSGGDAGQSVESVAKAYIAMAASARKKGDDFKLDFYKGQGKRETAAATIPTFRIDPITPGR